jgi:hypothetical protein
VILELSFETHIFPGDIQTRQDRQLRRQQRGPVIGGLQLALDQLQDLMDILLGRIRIQRIFLAENLEFDQSLHRPTSVLSNYQNIDKVAIAIQSISHPKKLVGPVARFSHLTLLGRQNYLIEFRVAPVIIFFFPILNRGD